jgi:AP-3 complex subunit mu
LCSVRLSLTYCDEPGELHIISSLQRWTRDKSLSFVPPDGRFHLFDYRYSPAATSTSLAATTVNAAKDMVAVPLSMKTSVEVADNTGMLIPFYRPF